MSNSPRFKVINEKLIQNGRENSSTDSIKALMSESENINDIQMSKKKYTVRKQLYRFFEKPDSSRVAMAFTFFISVLIVISVVCLCVQSLVIFKEKNGETKYILLWIVVEGIIAFLFTIEFVVRFLVIVNSFNSLFGFVKNFWNFIDLLAFVPFWIELVLYLSFRVKFNIEYLGILRTLRLLRLFQYWKATSNVQNVFKAIKRSFYSTRLI